MPSIPSAYLVVRKGAQFGRVYELEPGKKFLIGRAESNAVVLDDDLCSRFHAEILRTSSGQWAVRDCGSRNGTRVNETTLEKDHQLQTGDEISVGRNNLVFVTHLAEETHSGRIWSVIVAAAMALTYERTVTPSNRSIHLNKGVIRSTRPPT